MEGTVTRTFLENVFGLLRVDIASLKHEMAADIKGLTSDMNELGERIAGIEHTSNAHSEELDVHRCEILELRNKNEELHY
ncbi:hypothetical protein NDU88_003275 [Pleurodeles waltl]|uniref:Uncharacterized protein n=1 Tax=Pleurodeles waltl TaxID=8319 RepID=A0AAV7LL56_PLEWA|nr:hypothetical protein NDU88_003275 [Pleurodeles waltl]